MGTYDTSGGTTAIDYGYGTSYTTVQYERKHCGRCGYSEMHANISSLTYQCRMCGLKEAPYDNYYQQIKSQRDYYNQYMGLYPQPETASQTTNTKLEKPSRVEDGANKKKEKIMSNTLFEEGDKVTTNEDCCSAKVGIIYTITGGGIGDDASNRCSCTNNWTKVNPTDVGENKTSMLQPLEALSNLIQRTFSEDTKTLYRAGYLSKDLNITQKLTDALGEMFVGHIIAGDIKTCTLETFATELIAQAKNEILAAEKAEKKN